MTRAIIRRLALLLALALLGPPLAIAQQPALEYQGAAALGLELRRLGTTKRVLMIGAHPDDESTQILSTLALGQGADVAYLALSRGEGGQNGIGPELQEGLGLLRTEELLAARRLDGAKQYFTRAYDFGFSKDADETFRHWPRELILADVVAVIREFRPDIILSVFTGTTRDGHGQHQVAGIIAREAFEIAGDPARFPEQLARGLRPFTPAKLYQGLWGQDDGADAHLDTGELDPLLGRSYFQVAMASRSRHRSQDMGRALTPGPQVSNLQLAVSRSDSSAPGGSLFAGVDTTLSALATTIGASADEGSSLARAISDLRDYDQRVERIQDEFNPLAPDRIVADLADALRLVRAAEEFLPAGELHAAVAAEANDAEAALWDAANLTLDAIADDETVIPGQEFEVSVSLWNGGESAVAVRSLEPQLPRGWSAVAAEPLDPTLAPHSLVTRRFSVTAAPDATLTRPYFLRAEREGDVYAWPAEANGVGLPFEAPSLQATAAISIAGQPVDARTEATFRDVDRRQGESRRPVRVVAAVSVLLTPGVAVVPLSDSRTAPPPLRFTVRLRSEAPNGIAGTLTPRVPAGWGVEPASVPVRFAQPGEERTIDLTVRPPTTLNPGEAILGADFVTESGRSYDEGFTLVDYPHIRPRPLYHAARVGVRAFPVAVPAGFHVGYVPGAGDDAPEALQQLGIDVTQLSAQDLASGNLSRFDAILTGIRAYEVNSDLVAYNRRLFDYVQGGGTVVVQYNKYEYTEPGIAPFSVTMARPHDRVTDETAEVSILDTAHQAFTWPNRITGADFEGWSQERGLYFLNEWDDRMIPLLEMADPGEEPKRGSLLVARYGEGIYVYTGLAFFRQLPEGVPGAYRLLVNLLSLGKTP